MTPKQEEQKKKFADSTSSKLKTFLHQKTASGGDGISAELFHMLEDDAVTVLHSIYQQI